MLAYRHFTDLSTVTCQNVLSGKYRAIPRVLCPHMHCQYYGKYLVSPRIYRSTSLCNLCACAAWLVSLCTCMHVLKVFKKQAPPNSPLSLPTSLSETDFNNPLSSSPINKLPRGFVIHCDSFSPPLNYDNKIHEVRVYICINSPTSTDLF